MTTVLAAGTIPAYPVHLTAPPAPDRPSRALWLVKWLLIIPHGIVLLLLWPTFAVLSVVALAAILVTGRYPRAIFDFNVGVLRWTWRVGYYAYAALGTDRYPPFSLDDDPSYPARLHVDYPAELSRWKVLVKWWLLALPHYLILGVVTYAAVGFTNEVGRLNGAYEGGLLGLLILIVGVALLFTGRYPQGLYDLVLGLNRWAVRVMAYVALMTDDYPPFRLDQGGQVEPQDTAYPTTSRPVRRSGWRAGPATAVVAGALAVLLGLGMTIGGGVLQAGQEDGYFTTPTFTVDSPGYAVASDPLVLEGAGLDVGLGTVRIRAEAADGEDVFVGVAGASDAQDFLDDVDHSLMNRTFPRDLRHVEGGELVTLPHQTNIWVASASGLGQQTIELPAQPGTYVLVVMPTDGSAGIKAGVSLAATFPWMGPMSGALTMTGGVLLLAGAVAMGVAIRVAARQDEHALV